MAGTHRFEAFEVHQQQRQLLVDGRPVTIGARAFDVLCALIDRRDRIVSREELIEAVWPNRVVEENNLTIQIGTLRRLLGTNAIATIPGCGYRLTSRAADLDIAASAPRLRDARQGPPSPVHAPARPPPLIGRADDLRAVGELLNMQRQVTVVGAGGVGKTALARHVEAAARAGRTGWVDLAVIDDAAELPAAMAAAMVDDPPVRIHKRAVLEGQPSGSGRRAKERNGQGRCDTVGPCTGLRALALQTHEFLRLCDRRYGPESRAKSPAAD